MRIKETVLVVDDEKVNRDLLLRRLTRSGFEVEVAQGGDEALGKLSQTQFDLVLLDQMMPGKTGSDVLRELRTRYSQSDLPVIMVTAVTDSGRVAEALDLGANDYITKPVDFTVALARIRAQLSRKHAESARKVVEERYELAARAANGGLWDWDLETNEIFYSPRWKMMMGLGEEEVGKSPEEWFSRVHPDDVIALRTALHRHLNRETEVFEADYRIRRGDGECRWMMGRGVAMRHADGSPKRMAGSQNDITEKKTVDALTGLPNRLLFHERLCAALDRSHGDPSRLLAVCFVDVDRFKLVNDTFGHLAGDQLLVQFAQRLMAAMAGRNAIVARLGGDEFAVLLEDLADGAEAATQAERMTRAIRPAFDLGEREFFITASVGVVLSRAEHRTGEDLIRDADLAMYAAKGRGLGRCAVFDESMRQTALRRLQIETDLRMALPRGEFRVYYQPRVDLTTNQICGFEAMLRWKHPERGMVQPDDFNVCAAPPPDPDGSLTDLSLEELTQVEITSVARRDQNLMKAAAAVYVITAEDIVRSGATSLPDALRLAPGVEVAQITANTWAVSIRGFNSRSANKILVLVDGRSIYNNLFSGTFWDQNQIPLEDIERIEIVRGPGATMWGANAVDGVISIVTKPAQQTRGVVVSTEAGQNQLPDAYVRYGGGLGSNLTYRVDARFTELLPQSNAAGNSAGDRVASSEAGARLDWRISDRDTLTVDTQVYRGTGNEPDNQTFPVPSSLVSVGPLRFDGGFLRMQWKRSISDRSDLALQISETREQRDELVADGSLDTLDLDFQHHIHLSPRNDFNWGGGFRFHDDRVNQLLEPTRVEESLASLFAQNEFTLVPGRVTLTGGVKIEDFLYHANHQLEVEPQVRLLWTPRADTTFWAAVSRAVRMPSDLDRFLSIDYPFPSVGVPQILEFRGSADLSGEVLIAFEGGVRRQWGKHFSLDAAGFSNHYTHLVQEVIGTPFVAFLPSPVVIVPETSAGTGEAESRGVEVALSWSPSRIWRLQLSYDWMKPSFPQAAATSKVAPPGSSWGTPGQMGGLRSSWDVTRRWSFDASLYADGAVDAASGGPIPAYVRLDLRVARKLGEYGEFSTGVQNLVDPNHVESLSQYSVVNSYLRRSVFLKLIWRF